MLGDEPSWAGSVAVLRVDFGRCEPTWFLLDQSDGWRPRETGGVRLTSYVLLRRIGCVMWSQGWRGWRVSRLGCSSPTAARSRVPSWGALLVWLGLLLAALLFASKAAAQTNLLMNPGAEDAAGSTSGGGTIVPIPNWTQFGSFTVVQYGSGSFPSASVSGGIGGGNNFFAGGPGDAVSMANQDVSVAGEAAAIDAGTRKAVLSGFLGGFDTQGDNMAVTAAFLDASGGEFGTPLRIGPVGPDDRGNVTGYAPRLADEGRIPAGTRTIRVEMTATRASGSSNDGYADNLSLTVESTPPPPPKRDFRWGVNARRDNRVKLTRRSWRSFRWTATGNGNVRGLTSASSRTLEGGATVAGTLRLVARQRRIVNDRRRSRNVRFTLRLTGGQLTPRAGGGGTLRANVVITRSNLRRCRKRTGTMALRDGAGQRSDRLIVRVRSRPCTFTANFRGRDRVTALIGEAIN